MNVTPKIQSLIVDAEAAGFTHAVNGVRHQLYKADRWGNIRLGVAFSVTETGGFYQGYRTDLPLNCTTTIRTIKVCRQILGLKGTP